MLGGGKAKKRQGLAKKLRDLGEINTPINDDE
jgi:hypothetical protein